ncbi:hypothetical protein D3C78_1300920 [compost metagenome]
MMTRVVFFVAFFLVACTKESIRYYEYKDVVVTRVDSANYVMFYYGKYNLEGDDFRGLPALSVFYKGFDGGMGGYMIFKSDKRIEMIRAYGFFNSIDSTKIFLKDYEENYQYIDWTSRIKGKYDSVVYVSDVNSVETALNKNNNSKVKVIRPSIE